MKIAVESKAIMKTSHLTLSPKGGKWQMSYGGLFCTFVEPCATAPQMVVRMLTQADFFLAQMIMSYQIINKSSPSS